MNAGSDPAGDGCTLWFNGDWKACCDAHDYAYAHAVSVADKLLADETLRQCVAMAGSADVWHWLMGFVMFVGVSIFGWFYVKLKRR